MLQSAGQDLSILECQNFFLFKFHNLKASKGPHISQEMVMEMIDDCLEICDLESKPLSQNDKQVANVDELETILQALKLTNNQSPNSHDLQRMLTSMQKRVDVQERELAEARDNMKKAESGALVLKLRLAEVEQAEKALQSQLGEANNLKEFYKDLSDTAQQRIADNILNISIKLKDSEEREERHLQKVRYKLETAHSIDLIKRRVELQCTKHLLKKVQANLVLLEGKGPNTGVVHKTRIVRLVRYYDATKG